MREKLKGAADLLAFIAMVKEEGFEITKADFLRYEAKQIMALSDTELERVAGGANTSDGDSWRYKNCYDEFISQYYVCNTARYQCQ